MHWTHIVLYYNCQTYWILGYLIFLENLNMHFPLKLLSLSFRFHYHLNSKMHPLPILLVLYLINFTTISMVSPKGPRVLYRNWWVSKLSRMIHTSIYIPLYLHEYHTLDNLNGLRFLILIGDGSIQKRSLLFKYIYESRIIQLMAIQSVIRNVSKSKYT